MSSSSSHSHNSEVTTVLSVFLSFCQTSELTLQLVCKLGIYDPAVFKPYSALASLRAAFRSFVDANVNVEKYKTPTFFGTANLMAKRR